MSAPPEIATPRPDPIEEALALGRRENARLMNLVRCGLLGGFVVLYGIGIIWLDVPGFSDSWWLLAVYSGMAVAVWVAGNRFTNVLNVTRFAVPLIDIPAVTQEFTKSNESDVLVSDSIVYQVGEADGLFFESVGKVEVRGRRQEIEILIPIAK